MTKNNKHVIIYYRGLEMKLDSKYLKSLILEVIDEATRRDFLKGAAGLGGLAALGKGISSLYDDEEENPENLVDQIKDAPPLTKKDVEEMGLNPEEFNVSDPDAWKEPKAPYAIQQGKYALDQLRVTPENLEYYSVAPAASNTGDGYVYVDMGMLYDMADQDAGIAESIDVSQAFFNDWTIKRHYKYVFGQLAFWGTFKDPEDPQSRKMAPSFPIQTDEGETIQNIILPLAWTVSLEYWMERFISLEARLQQYPDNTNDILREAELTESQYYEMKARYQDVVSRVSDPTIVTNPNYNPEEEK